MSEVPPNHAAPVPPMPSQPPIGQGLICRCCGRSPAAAVYFRTHIGALFFLVLKSVPGPFCVTCGLAVFRSMTTETLAKGWWSPFSLFIFNPYVIVANCLALRKINKLPHTPALPWPPLPPGKPIHRRWPAYFAVLPVILVLWVVLGPLIYYCL